MSEEKSVSTKNIFEVLKDRVEELKVITYHKKSEKTSLQNGVYVSQQSDIPQSNTKGRFIQIATSALEIVKSSEYKVIFRIMNGLKFNNPLL